MSKLGDLKKAEDGSYMILTHIEDPGHIETWQPAATFMVQMRPLEAGAQAVPIPLYDALLAEGWLDPDAAKEIKQLVESLPLDDYRFRHFANWLFSGRGRDRPLC